MQTDGASPRDGAEKDEYLPVEQETAGLGRKKEDAGSVLLTTTAVSPEGSVLGYPPCDSITKYFWHLS